MNAQSVAVPGHIPAELVINSLPGLSGVLDNPIAALDSLFDGPPIVFSAPGGFWIVRGTDLIREVMQRPQIFSSSPPASNDGPPIRRLIPLQVDPPEHTRFRHLLAPWFSPAAAAAFEPDIRRVARSLLEKVAGQGRCDALEDLARPLPAAIFCQLLGLPQEDAVSLAHLNECILRHPDPEERKSARARLVSMLSTFLEARRRSPQNDLLTAAATGKVDGRPLTDAEGVDMAVLFFQAGLDTVTSALAFSLDHLARNPDHQRQLRENAELIPRAVEELLRTYAVVNVGRIVSSDIEFHGVQMRAGDRLLIVTALSCRDPKEFSNADCVDFGRDTPHRHAAFGTGPHRCPGSHLARLELAVALEEIHRRLPMYRLEREAAVRYHGGGVFGLDALRLEW